MRLSMCDLVLLAVPFYAGLLTAVGVLGRRDGSWVGLLAGLLLVLLVAPRIYRALHFFPLFFPRCPHCRCRPEAYGVVQHEWPRAVLCCCRCEQFHEIRFVYPERLPVASDFPVLVLRWPWFLGWWRRVPSSPETSRLPQGPSGSR